MNLLSLLPFLALIINLEVAYIIYRLDPRSRLNITYLMLCLINALICFCYMFYYSAPSSEAAAFWCRLASVGWIPNMTVSFHFVLRLVQREKRIPRRMLVVMYLPAVLFVLLELTVGLYEKDFIFIYGTWHAVINSTSPWLWGFIIYICSLFAAGVYLLRKWEKSAGIELERLQAHIIILTIILIFPALLAGNFILPLFGIYYIPDVGVIIIPLLFLIGIIYAVTRFKFMMPNLHPDIMDRVSDLLIITDFKGKILRMNRIAETFLETTERDNIGKSLGAVIIDQDKIMKDINTFESGEHFSVPYDLNFKLQNNIIRPMTVSVSLLKDSYGQNYGCILIGKDAGRKEVQFSESSRHLQAEDSERRFTQKIMLISKSALSMNELSPEEDLYSFIAQKIREQAGNSLVFVNSYHNSYQGVQVKAFAGLPENILKFNEILGSTPVGIFNKLDRDKRVLYENGRIGELPSGLYEMWSGMIPEDVCLEIGNALKLGKRYGLGLIKQGEFLGNIEILMCSDSELENQLMIETLARVGTIALTYRELEKKESFFLKSIGFIRNGLGLIVSAKDRGAVFNALCSGLLDLLSDSMIITIKSGGSGRMIFESIYGNEKYINMLHKILRKDLRGLKINFKGNMPSCINSDNLCMLGGGLSELTGGAIKKEESELVEKMMGLRNVYGMSNKKNGHVKDIISIMTRNPMTPEQCTIAEIYIVQAFLTKYC